MVEFNVAEFVAKLERLGVRLTTVPLADGKLRINRWRMLHAVEHTQQIQDLWESQIGKDNARIGALAAFVHAHAPERRVESDVTKPL